MDEMISFRNVGDRKGLHLSMMPDVDNQDVDGVIVVNHSLVFRRIVDCQGVRHNNLQHIHGCDPETRYTGDYCGTT